MLDVLLLDLAAQGILSVPATDVATTLRRFGSHGAMQRAESLAAKLRERYALDRTSHEARVERAVARACDVVVHLWLCKAHHDRGGALLAEQLVLYGNAHFEALTLAREALGLEPTTPTASTLRVIPDVPAPLGAGEEGSDPGIWATGGEAT